MLEEKNQQVLDEGFSNISTTWIIGSFFDEGDQEQLSKGLGRISVEWAVYSIYACTFMLKWISLRK